MSYFIAHPSPYEKAKPPRSHRRETPGGSLHDTTRHRPRRFGKERSIPILTYSLAYRDPLLG
jgi:hypothetical protein